MLPRNFVDADSIPAHLNCTMCEEVFIDPVMDKKCQHTFCKECIVSWIKLSQKKEQEATCPICRKILCKAGELKRNLLAWQIISGHQIYCQNKPSCQWEGPLDMADAHIRTCRFETESMSG